ncbi:MAG: hypothetical protein RLZZ519_1384 [Bacteroidota bacterium]|jgi:hypothetical protein
MKRGGFQDRIPNNTRVPFARWHRHLTICKAGLLVFLMIFLSLSRCANPKSAKPDLQKALIGDWDGVATQLTFQTEGRSQRSRTITVSEGELEQRMSRTTPQMTYFADHRYVSMYVSLIDFEGRQARDTMRQEGTWELKGDTLTIKEPMLSVPESSYLLKFKDNELELSCTMDMDGDGEVDDKYWMLQRRRK